MTRLRHDNRGAVSFHIVLFVASLILGAVLYILLEPLGAEMISMAESRTSTAAAAQGQQYVRWTFQNMHIIVIGMGVLQLVAAAVYEGRVSR